jgi:ribosomal protein S21
MARNVRVELRGNFNSNYYDKEKGLKILLGEFRKACHTAGIIKELKERSVYESPSEKKRRLKKESENNILKQKMKESFINNKTSSKKKKDSKKSNNPNKK